MKSLLEAEAAAATGAAKQGRNLVQARAAVRNARLQRRPPPRERGGGRGGRSGTAAANRADNKHCFICGRNHLARDCPDRSKPRGQGRGNSSSPSAGKGKGGKGGKSGSAGVAAAMAITEGTRELIRNELRDLVEDFDSDRDGPPPLAHSASSGVDDVPDLNEDEDPWADGDPARGTSACSRTGTSRNTA